MNTAVGRGHRGQQRGPAGGHGAEGGKRATVGFALAADLSIAPVKIAGAWSPCPPALLSEAAHSAAGFSISSSCSPRRAAAAPWPGLCPARRARDLADGLDSDEVAAVSGRIRAALTAWFPVFGQVLIDITDATPADRVRAAANLALLAGSVRQEER
jgi:hypothetical protein